MKINIAFLGKHNAKGIWGGDRKFEIYFAHLSLDYVKKFFVYVTTDPAQVMENGERVVLLENDLIDFLQKQQIAFVYFAWAKVSPITHQNILEQCTGLINVNFTPCYDPSWNQLNLIISKTDYWKLKRMHGELTNAYVVYNPIDVDNRIRLASVAKGIHRAYFQDKRYLIGRLGRAEPSKWHFLIIATLVTLQWRGNYTYWFIFAGMPLLYRKVLKLLLNQKMYASLLFLPELRQLDDIAEFYASIDLFRQTSRIGESFGNVIAESYCFKKPVITDYKHFYRNWKVLPDLYDAQIELVDHEHTGGYCNYPHSVIAFLEGHTLAQLQVLGQHGFEKVQQEYHITHTAQTLIKVLYERGKNKEIYLANPSFEQLVATPTTQAIANYAEEYHWRIHTCLKANTISWSGKMSYKLLHMLWRWLEYAYLLRRKQMIFFFNISIEQF